MHKNSITDMVSGKLRKKMAAKNMISNKVPLERDLNQIKSTLNSANLWTKTASSVDHDIRRESIHLSVTLGNNIKKN